MTAERTAIYQTKIYGSADPIIVDVVPQRAKVLDVGCGNGTLGDALTVSKKCEVYGVDVSVQAVAQARERIQQAVVCDIETEPVPFADEFDWVILADVIEHIYDPVAVLRKLRPSLKPDGCLLVAVPNLVCWSVRMNVLLGRFDYSDKGVLDWTHIRFFTWRTLQSVLNQAGYAVEQVRVEPVWVRFFSRRFPRLVMAVAGRRKTLFAKRFIVVCQKCR